MSGMIQRGSATVEVTVPAGAADLAVLWPVLVVQGEVEECHRLPVLVAERLDRPLPTGPVLLQRKLGTS